MDSKLRELVPGLITDYLITVSASRQSASWDFGLSGRRGRFSSSVSSSHIVVDMKPLRAPLSSLRLFSFSLY
jgi:hypothetical protein